MIAETLERCEQNQVLSTFDLNLRYCAAFRGAIPRAFSIDAGL